MTDTETNIDNGGTGETTAPRPDRRRWRKPLLIGAMMVGFALVPGIIIGAQQASAWVGHMGHTFSGDPERMAERIDRRVERALSYVNATAEQKEKVRAVAKSAVTDLAALGIKPDDTRKKMMELMKAETIDPAAIEALRAEQFAQMETASKRLVTALTEAAAILTPEQRRQLTEHWQQRHADRGHRGRRGHGRYGDHDRRHGGHRGHHGHHGDRWFH